MVTAPVAALYVPGDRPDRFAKAADRADAVIIDLEDAVAPDRKDVARRAAFEFLSAPPPCPVWIRINRAGTPWHDDDVAAVAQCRHVSAVRVPKVESAADVQRVADRCPEVPIQAIIESALGVENSFVIAGAGCVSSISLGEADLASSLAVTDVTSLAWVRTRVVVAARAAGLPAPMMSVWTSVTDLEGLAASCRAGLAAGFFGRTAIHPAQVPVIREACRPTEDQVERARAVLDALSAAEGTSTGVARLPDGHMVDVAMRPYAEWVLATASRGRS